MKDKINLKKITHANSINNIKTNDVYLQTIEAIAIVVLQIYL